MTSQQISTEIQTLLRSTGRSGIERVIDYIGNSDLNLLIRGYRISDNKHISNHYL